MKKSFFVIMALAAIVSLGLTGCTSTQYVQKQIGELQQQVAANNAAIISLEQSDSEQNAKLSRISDTVVDAIARVEDLREQAEGKFLYQVTLNDDMVHFGFDSSQLSEEAREALDVFALRIKSENKECYIEIQGHTDTLGPEEYNFHLGLVRARAVMSYLHLNHNIPLNRMNTYSYGATKPIADESVAGHGAKNRRVTLVVMS
ncbi:MAG: OmpA family protein [Deltaproteobacteria bacterium]|nr:MAG: OmpA family protein [Deltaproteobacteria bacterium]